MNKIKFIKLFVLVLVTFLSYALGDFMAIKNGRKIDNKKVVFRIEYLQEDVDFSLKAMLKQLRRKYEKEGYKVYYSYFGNLYPKELNNAGINYFVRSYFVSFDKRIFEKAHNVYLVPYIYKMYREEFRNFDEYMSPQKKFSDAGDAFGIDITYLAKEEFDNKKLDRKNANGVVYIYEKWRGDILDYMKTINGAKIYSSVEFAKLNDKELEDVLTWAKVVVFDSNRDVIVDDDYVPFGVYDILGYGLEVILDKGKATQNIKGLSYFETKEDLMHKLQIF